METFIRGKELLLAILTLVQFHYSDHFSTYSSSHLKNSPWFVSPIENVTIAQGRNAKLSCTIENISHYKVAWIYKSPKDRTILTAGSQTITKNPRISIMQEGASWTLNINKVIKRDGGTYLCQINTRPPTSQIGYLSVVVSPVIDDTTSSNDVSIDEGHDVTLTCDARGDPDPHIKWIREDGATIRSSSNQEGLENVGKILTIYNAKREDAGAYLCIATNGVPPAVSKRMILAVYFPPIIVDEPVSGSNYGVVMGTDLHLSCRYKSRPMGTVKWSRRSQEIISMPPFVTITSRQGTDSISWISTLSLRLLQEKDFGIFNCEVQNRLGKDNTSFSVYEVTTTSTTAMSSTTMELTTRRVYPTINRPKYNDHDSQPPYFPYWLTNETTTRENKNHDEKNTISDKRKNSPSRQDIIQDSFFGGTSASRGTRHFVYNTRLLLGVLAAWLIIQRLYLIIGM